MYMDIDLLSRMVKELLLDKDEVRLPGVGTFVAEIVPSSFSDKGFTINPPYRKISFRQNLDGDDDSLVREYADAAGIPESDARRVLSAFLEEMKEVLKEKKTIIFPALGRLRATKENNFFFVADENLDIYPDGFGLEPISLKSHEESPAEVSATVAGLADIITPANTLGSAAEVPVQSFEPEVTGVAATSPAVRLKEVHTEEIAPAAGQEEAYSEETVPAAETETAELAETVPAIEPLAEIAPEPSTADYQLENLKTESSFTNNQTTETAEQTISADNQTAEISEQTIPASFPTAETAVQPEQAVVAELSSQAAEPARPTAEPAHDNAVHNHNADGNHNTDGHNADCNNAARDRKSRLPFILAACLIIVILTVLAFLLIARFAPDFIDRLLYNKEDLELVRQLF